MSSPFAYPHLHLHPPPHPPQPPSSIPMQQPIHSYQPHEPHHHIIRKPEKESESESEMPELRRAQSDEDISPVASLHRAVLSKRAKETAAAAATATAPAPSSSNSTTPPASSPSFNNSFAAFPPLGNNRCVIHAPPAPATATPHPSSCLCAPSSASSSPSRSTRAPIMPCCLPRASYWNLRCSCLFSALPDELLLFNVFALLPVGELAGLAAVCSRWKWIVTEPMLWRRVDLSKHVRSLDARNVHSILSRVGGFVEELKLCNLRFLEKADLMRLASEHLAGNTSLKTLHLCSLRHVDGEVISSLLTPAISCSLRSLSLFGCVSIDDASVRTIRERCANLEELSLRGCSRITDAAFVVEEDETTNREQEVTGEWADTALQGMQIHSNPHQALPSTHSFSYSNSPSFPRSGSFLPPLPRRPGTFAHLTNLNLATCKLSEAGLLAAIEASPHLSKLNLHGLNPTDRLLDVLTATVGANLKELHLSSANPFGGNMHLTDRALGFLAARCLEIRCLNLQGSAKITDEGVRTIMQSCKQMERINLGGVHRLTDQAVRYLCQVDENGVPLPSTQSRSTLTHVSLFQCVHLTNVSIELIATNLHALQHLDVHSCASLTDASLDVLLTTTEAEEDVPCEAEEEEEDEQAKQVDWASPSAPSSTESTNRSIHSATSSSSSSSSSPTPSSSTRSFSARSSSPPSSFVLPALQSLDVGSCRNITAEAVQRLRTGRSNLTITYY